MRYEASIMVTKELTFEFSDEDIEDGDTADEAAFQLALSYPADEWVTVDEELQVTIA